MILAEAALQPFNPGIQRPEQAVKAEDQRRSSG